MMEAAYDRRRYDQQQYPTRPPPNPPLPSFYPRIQQAASSSGPPVSRAPPPVPGPINPGAAAPSSGIGIKVALKPQYRMAPPVHLSPVMGEIPRTSIQFDFDFERKVIDDAERGVLTQVRNTQLANGGETVQVEDPVISKYLALGLNREAISLGIAAYGDVQNKVVEFCSAYSLLREMGFPSHAVAGALVMHDNDKEKALAQFV